MPIFQVNGDRILSSDWGDHTRLNVHYTSIQPRDPLISSAIAAAEDLSRNLSLGGYRKQEITFVGDILG
ncbi:hypothetical protein F1880_001252 [Penicillium rolfsii]|nr:hypothetical protein F1880_001252 [Penicillium rolfsii]